MNTTWDYVPLRANTRPEWRDAYRAGASVHRGLAEGLADREGDVGGADARGGLDGQLVSLLADFHRRAGGCCHRHFPEEHVDP